MKEPYVVASVVGAVITGAVLGWLLFGTRTVSAEYDIPVYVPPCDVSEG